MYCIFVFKQNVKTVTTRYQIITYFSQQKKKKSITNKKNSKLLLIYNKKISNIIS